VPRTIGRGEVGVSFEFRAPAKGSKAAKAHRVVLALISVVPIKQKSPPATHQSLQRHSLGIATAQAHFSSKFLRKCSGRITVLNNLI